MFKDIYRKWFPKTSFPYRLKNILNIPKFIKEIFSFLKKGYPYHAVYDHDWWFMKTEINILTEFKETMHSIPVDISKEEWKMIIEEMIELLKVMEDDDYTGDTKTFEEKINKREEAKNKFFELYSKYFWNLWD